MYSGFPYNSDKSPLPLQVSRIQLNPGVVEAEFDGGALTKGPVEVTVLDFRTALEQRSNANEVLERFALQLKKLGTTFEPHK